MITVKQILEQYSLETDKATADEIKLAELSDAGLFESSKLPMIKRSLNKNVNEMTEAEKKTLKYLLESLMTHVLVEKNQKVDKSAYPSDKDMPTVIILKRKAIRVFPDNQKIGMYYSQALDRYISIPFGPNVKDLSPQLNEQTGMSPRQIMVPQASQLQTAATKRLLATRRADARIGQEEEPLSIAFGHLGKYAASAFTGFQDDKPKSLTSVPGVPRKTTQTAEPWGAAPKTTKQKQSSTTQTKAGRTIGPGASSKPPQVNRPSVAESFKDNLRIIREQKEINELAPALPIAGAGIATVSRIAGSAISLGGKALKSFRNMRTRTQQQKQQRQQQRKRDVNVDVDVNLPDTDKKSSKSSPDTSSSFRTPINSQHAFSEPGRATPTVSAAQSVVPTAALTRQLKATGGQYPIQQPVYESIKNIVEYNNSNYQLQIGEETISINKSIAKKIIKLHESLNRKNKNKLEKMLNEDITSLTKVINFAIKQ